MALKRGAVRKKLEESVNRLEETRDNTLRIHYPGDTRLEKITAFTEVSAEIDGIEAALLIAESRIDELAQVLDEEIDNLRGLLDKIEEDPD